MGKAAKGSRKGKKAWRANIRTDDIDEFYEKQTRDAHAGAAAIPSLPSDSLFFVDKPASASTSSAADPPAQDVPVKRKIERNREKVLYHESLLKRNPYVQPVPSSLVSKKDKKKFKKHAKKKELKESKEEKSVPMEEDSAEPKLDIWGGDAKGDALGKKGMKRLLKNRSTTSVFPAVEVEPPGCSFNPKFDDHQDSLAQAVADEMRKIYTKELGPKPVPLTVLGEAVAEEDKFFLDAADDGDAAEGDGDAAEGGGDKDADGLAGERKSKTKRVTRVELNKRARRKERLRTEADAKKLEVLSKQIDSLPNIIAEIAKEDEEKEKMHTRRTVAKQERLKSAPRRLGRHKFEPAPVQVLLTEEISGSLRQLKGCCNLARDRYKSIEKRGILAPNKKIRSNLMDKQCSQEYSIIENKGDAFIRMVKPKAMQLQLLPPDVLRDILSRLSMKQVVRMSILSREWRQLRICHPDLVFTEDTFGINTTMDTDQSMPVGELLKMHDKKLELLTRKFIDNVDSVLRPLWSSSTTTTTTLDNFVIKFGLRRKHKYYIDRWVSFSTASRAKHIALDFTSDGSCSGSEFEKYVFPLCDLSGPNGSCIKSLDLGYIFLKPPHSFCGITNLKKLTLKTVSINCGDLKRLLLSCALLESLNIEMCSHLSSLCVPQELSRLQYLRVRYCDLEMLELHAPNLTKFEFDDYLIQTMLSESSKLSEAFFVSNLRVLSGYDDVLDYIFTELPAALPHVHTLLLLLSTCQVERFSNTRDSFICLKHLNMNLSLYPDDDSWVMGFVNLLELAPLLEEMELHMDPDRYCYPNPRTVMSAQGPLHRHLKSVYMSGFSAVSGLAELALYILENATVLERMVVDPLAGMKDDLNTEHFCSVSKAGSSEKFVLPTQGDLYRVEEKRLFARDNLDREEFRHILTIL